MAEGVKCIAIIKDHDPVFYARISTLQQLKASLSEILMTPEKNIIIKVKINDLFLIIPDEVTFTHIGNEQNLSNSPVNFYIDYQNYSTVSLSQRIISYKFYNKLQNNLTIAYPDRTLTLKELSDEILIKEGINEKRYICAMYTAEGNPLSGALCQMFSVKFQDVSSDFLCIFILEYFDKPVPPKINHNNGNKTVNITGADLSKSIPIKVDLDADTVLVLKQKIYSAIGVPPFELILSFNDNTLANDSKILNKCNIISGSQICYSKKVLEFNQKTYKSEIVQSVKQTDNGLRVLHHFLYGLKKNNCDTYSKFSSFLRYTTENCSALLHSLYEVTLNKNVSLLDAIALEEGFMLVNKKILKEVFKLNIEESKLLEYTLEVVGFILHISASPSLHLENEETFETIDSFCSISHEELKDPVPIKTKNSTILCNLDALRNAINSRQQISGVDDNTKIDCKVDPLYKAIIKRNESENKTAITR